MTADILERLDFMLISRRSDEDAIIRDARAEIVRLRGEVARLEGVALADELIAVATRSFGGAIAPAEAKDPAPAMPNGVEDIDWPFTYIVPDSKHEYVPKHHAERKIRDALRAADNRDAAGVERQPDGYMAQWAADQLRSNKYVSCHLYNHQNKVIHGDGKEAVPFYFWPPAPAAVPAGEAVAWIRDNLPESLHGMGVVDVLQLLLDGGIAAEKDLIDAESPQPADGEAVAPLGYVRRKAISAMREDDEVTGIMVHVDAPSDSVPVYLHPPAPVQAAPQEAEGAAERLYIAHTQAHPRAGRVPPWRELAEWERAPWIKAANHSACELGADDVGEIISRDKRVWALAALAEKCGAVKDEGESGLFWTLTLGDFYKLEAALQHRGDSQEVGRG